MGRFASVWITLSRTRAYRRMLSTRSAEIRNERPISLQNLWKDFNFQPSSLDPRKLSLPTQSTSKLDPQVPCRNVSLMIESANLRKSLKRVSSEKEILWIKPGVFAAPPFAFDLNQASVAPSPYATCPLVSVRCLLAAMTAAINSIKKAAPNAT